MTLSHTTGTITGILQAVRCAHRCLQSGQGYMLFELSNDYEHISVTALSRPEPGYDIVKQCNHAHCKGWNGVRFRRRQLAA